MTDLFKGTTYFFRGLAMLRRPGIRTYAFLPMAIAVVLFGALTWVSALYFGDALDWAMARIPDWLQWLAWLCWIVFVLACLMLVAFTFTITAGFVASPFHGMLAQAVEVSVTGRPIPGDPWLTMVKKLPGTLWQEVSKITYSLALAIPFLLLFLIPGVFVVAPFLWLLFCAWITAFGFTDYAMSNHGLGCAAIRKALRQRRMLALGFGGVCFGALTIPVFNIVALPAAVCGGALLWAEQLLEANAPATAGSDPPGSS